MKTKRDKSLLAPEQQVALGNLRNGSILCGRVGSGKSRVAIAYWLDIVPDLKPYIITTARKRDSHDWEDEYVPFAEAGCGEFNPVVDSWNNIGRYEDVRGAFFIFDEQRAIGSGAWAKAFVRIAKKNQWIMLSATPGDNWMAYISVFIAHGWYRNRTQFLNMHAVYPRFSRWPSKSQWRNEAVLEEYRKRILVDIPYKPRTVRHIEHLICSYDRELYRDVSRTRQKSSGDPIESYTDLLYMLRQASNSIDGDPPRESRRARLGELLATHRKALVFYNFDYELDDIKDALEDDGVSYAEYNGHKHESIPIGDSWCYLVQYSSGAEGWNCTTTDTMIFWSMNYSYSIYEQAQGRIDRRSTPFRELHYYVMRTNSRIDQAIWKALLDKGKFSEAAFYEAEFGAVGQ